MIHLNDQHLDDLQSDRRSEDLQTSDSDFEVANSTAPSSGEFFSQLFIIFIFSFVVLDPSQAVQPNKLV